MCLEEDILFQYVTYFDPKNIYDMKRNTLYEKDKCFFLNIYDAFLNKDTVYKINPITALTMVEEARISKWNKKVVEKEISDKAMRRLKKKAKEYSDFVEERFGMDMY